jgi:tetratricopeptide (TPR) repeat protein
MDLIRIRALFQEAAQFADRGDYEESAEAYERVAVALRAPGSSEESAEVAQLLRSTCFNLAQVLNKRGEFQKALTYVEEGLNLSPTDLGRAIGQSAKGEALYGLGQVEKALTAFRDAVLAHPIVGPLNSADSMTRLASDECLGLAEEWVELVVKSFGSELKPQSWAVVDTIRGRIAAHQGDYATARAQFESALRADPDCSDAKLQLRLLPIR